MTIPVSTTRESIPTVDGSELPQRVQPAALALAAPALTDHSSDSLAGSGRLIFRTIISAWVDAAADAVLDALLKDVRAGVIPGPQERPHDFESALAARAEEAAAVHPDLTLWGCPQGSPHILAFAHSGLGGPHGAWQTPPTPFVRLVVRSAAAEQAVAQGVAGAAGLCVLRPGDRLGAAEMGFEVVIDWAAFTRRVLRDDVLRTVALSAKGRHELLLTVEYTGGPHALPCRVRTAVPQPESVPTSDRRRRRR